MEWRSAAAGRTHEWDWPGVPCPWQATVGLSAILVVFLLVALLPRAVDPSWSAMLDQPRGAWCAPPVDDQRGVHDVVKVYLTGLVWEAEETGKS